MLSFQNRNFDKTVYIAHRGASVYEHENTLKAFQKAIDIQADAIELDVRKTKDNVLVVHHDVSIKSYKTVISKLNYFEIQEFNSSSKYHIPTLEEVLQLCKNKISLDIELKEVGYETLVVDVALKYFDKENILFTSFMKKSLEAIKKYDNDINCGFLFDKPIIPKLIPKDVEFLLPRSSLCKLGYLKLLQQLGKPIIVWTVDRIDKKEKFITQNIFGIITNDPISV